jgi:hypothetical protein
MAIVYFNLLDYPKFIRFCDKFRPDQSYSSSLVAEGYSSANFESDRKLDNNRWSINEAEYLMFQLKWS